MRIKEKVISLENASVVYRTESGEGRRVWSGVSLDIYKGEWLAVIGPNGSGKSTLASVLLGLNPLSQGRIMQETTEGAMKIRGVLQLPEAQFIGETVAEELDFLPAAQQLTNEEREIWYVDTLSAVGLSISPWRTVATLSGGQKQLVNLAVALAQQPEVLVLDEPTAMLDPAARKEVREAVRLAHHRGTTIIWISHRLEEVADATRVIGFGAGSITFDGEPQAFFYDDRDGGPSPCLKLGFEPPFAVQTAMALMNQGLSLKQLPMNMEQLAEAVSCR